MKPAPAIVIMAILLGLGSKLSAADGVRIAKSNGAYCVTTAIYDAKVSENSATARITWEAGR